MILGGRYRRYSIRPAPAPSPLSLMSGFKICSDGELLPRYVPCPPPFSPFRYYPPAPPLISDPDRSQISLSTGAIAGIVILLGFVFVLAGLFIIKCAARSTDSPAGSRHELQAIGLSRTAADSAASGLEDILVKLLPVCPYRPNKLDDSSGECAVCLSCFEEEEFVRILPRCQHTFHLRCIDKWFESHANCPLCREKITLQVIQAPDEPPQQRSEAVAVSLSDEGNEPHVEEEQENSAAPARNDREANGAGDCEGLRESERADAARSTPGGIRSFPGPRCEDCRTKQAATGLKSVRTDESWSSTTMAARGILRRSHSTGSMKLERSGADRHSQLSLSDDAVDQPIYI